MGDHAELTLVSLLLGLNTDCQVLAGIPLNLIALGVIVDKVTTVSALLLVVVSLGDGLVGEEIVRGELEDQAEARLLKVLHADVSKVLQSCLIAVGDDFGKADLVLHGREPEFGNTSNIVGDLGVSVLLSLLGVGLLEILILASLNLVLGRLNRSVDD